MTFKIEYRRTIRLKPYETVTIGMQEEFTGTSVSYQGCYLQVKEQVDYWIDQVREELGEDE